MDYDNLHIQYKENNITGRYLNMDKISSILAFRGSQIQTKIIGQSVESRNIYGCELGHGKVKILMWSQMHGNESTTTKGLIDFMNFLNGESELSKQILNQYSFYIIPMLNPDGAERYTRVNANQVDLNRDFQDLSQPESQLLMRIFNDFKPDFCFNLHDQRSIFGVGDTGKPATVSFLAPSFNEDKTYNLVRLKAVELIMNMIGVLDQYIPGQIGRFDDAFNRNCVGDTFQSLNVPTILIEAGHFPADYQREITRKYVFISLISAFLNINENVTFERFLSEYLQIPQNVPNYFDFIYKNVTINYDGSDIITNFAIQYQEELVAQEVVFKAYVAKIGNLDDYFGHVEFDAKNAKYLDGNHNYPELNEEVHFSIDIEVKFVNGFEKK